MIIQNLNTARTVAEMSKGVLTGRFRCSGKKAGKQPAGSGQEKPGKESSMEDANLTLPEQIAKAYMGEEKQHVSVKTFYAEKISEETGKPTEPGKPEGSNKPEILEKFSGGSSPEKENDTNGGAQRYISGWLVCVKGDHYGKSFDIYEGENTIGRGADADICLTEDRYVSDKIQTVITYDQQENAFFAGPGNAREVFYVNDKIVLKKTEIFDGDIVEIGRTELIFKALCGAEFCWKKQGSKEE